MDLYFLDYFAHKKLTPLHGVPLLIKLAVAVVFLSGAILAETIEPLLALGLILVLLYGLVRPPRACVPLLAYPLIFTGVFAASSWGGDPVVFAVMALKVVVAAAVMLLLLLTTPSTSLFSFASKLLPDALVTGLYLTYRSVFILSDSIADLIAALRLRGGISFRAPRASLGNIGSLFGVMFVRALTLSERQYDAMRLKGFTGKVYFSRFPRP